MGENTIVYFVAAPDPLDAIRTAWDAEARGLAMLGLEPEDDADGSREHGHVYRVRVPRQRDGRVSYLGMAEEVKR